MELDTGVPVRYHAMFIRDFIDILAFHVHIHGTLAALSSHARHSLHLGIAVIILIGMVSSTNRLSTPSSSKEIVPSFFPAL